MERRVKSLAAASRVMRIVACGDREIADVVEAAGGRAVMTDPGHPTGSDRIHAAIARLPVGDGPIAPPVRWA